MTSTGLLDRELERLLTNENSYGGPAEIAWAAFPGKGRSYRAVFEGRQIELSFSLKSKRMHLHVDGVEWGPQ